MSSMNGIAKPGISSNLASERHAHTLDRPTINGDDDERKACLSMEHGFHLRQPPPPHKLSSFITADEDLFQTIHMGRPTIDHDLWQLKIHGLVEQPYTRTLSELRSLPSTTITSFHECYGSPLKPPTTNVWRIGNVKWTGVRLTDLLSRAKPLPKATFVWSDGLDSGSFDNISADRYQKDLPIAKAMSPEVLVAYEMNGEPLNLERGGPVRLVVPGWFGTNSTKWLCSLRLTEERSSGPFTTTFYNELVPGQEHTGRMRPVWEVEPNSIIVSPRDGDLFEVRSGGLTAEVEASGWAWSGDGIRSVEISVDDGETFETAAVARRSQWEWQHFRGMLRLGPGTHRLSVRATSRSGVMQPLADRRNHVHTINVLIEKSLTP